MESALQLSLQQNLRTRITIIEVIELALLGVGLWSLMAILPGKASAPDLNDQIVFLLNSEGLLLGSWVIYNVYMRIARAAGGRVDIALWMIASAFTGSYTFWAWTILDINRLLMVRLFYQGEAPVEYAWSAKSKYVRKLWEQGQRPGSM